MLGRHLGGYDDSRKNDSKAGRHSKPEAIVSGANSLTPDKNRYPNNRTKNEHLCWCEDKEQRPNQTAADLLEQRLRGAGVFHGRL